MSTLPKLHLSAVTPLPPSATPPAPVNRAPAASDDPPAASSTLAHFDWQPAADGVLDAIQRVYR
jgi:hypothetical protein